LNNLDLDKINIIDVRYFNEASKEPVQGAINIPVAYLKRNLNEIPDRNLHVIGLTFIEKNISIRILKQKGFQVSGYTIFDHNRNHIEIKTIA
jgi:rhodanese-related sulfurtransferase